MEVSHAKGSQWGALRAAADREVISSKMLRHRLPLPSRSQWWAVRVTDANGISQLSRNTFSNSHPTSLLPLHREITAEPCQPGASTSILGQWDWWAGHHYCLSAWEGPGRTMPQVVAHGEGGPGRLEIIHACFVVSELASARKKLERKGWWWEVCGQTASWNPFEQLNWQTQLYIENPSLYSRSKLLVKVCLGSHQVTQWDTICNSSQTDPKSKRWRKNKSCVAPTALFCGFPGEPLTGHWCHCTEAKHSSNLLFVWVKVSFWGGPRSKYLLKPTSSYVSKNPHEDGGFVEMIVNWE